MGEKTGKGQMTFLLKLVRPFVLKKQETPTDLCVIRSFLHARIKQLR